MTRMSTWENLGTESNSNNVLELLEQADLNYTAVTEDLFVEHDGTKIQIPNKKVVLREDTKEIFGIVSDRYQLCQNRDALDFIEYLDDVSLVKAGNVGGLTWMIGKLPEVKVLGDAITPHLIFQNSHDGSCSIKTTICMLRIVCQNQFVASFKESPATISIRHQGDLNEKLLVARETMQGVYDYVKHYDEVANTLVTKKITPKKFNEIVEGFFEIPEDASDRTKNFIIDRRERFQEAYTADDNQNFKGTKWGLINAYSDLITHEEYARKTVNWETNRFVNSLSPNTMNEFMKFIKAAA
jgi:phage/plasmid-like protein (TIGR03299 family)